MRNDSVFDMFLKGFYLLAESVIDVLKQVKKVFYT